MIGNINVWINLLLTFKLFILWMMAKAKRMISVEGTNMKTIIKLKVKDGLLWENIFGKMLPWGYFKASIFES